MITPFETYFIFKLDDFAFACMILSMVFGFISFIRYADVRNRNDKFGISDICIFLIALFFFCFGVLIPQTKQAVLIYLVPKIANNKDVGNIPDKISDALVNCIDSVSKGDS